MGNLTIKGRTIGQGKPLICVPVMGKSKEEIVNQIGKLVSEKVDMIEWRVDAFGKASSPNAIRDLLSSIRELVKDTILVYTYRSKAQGGMGDLDSRQIYDIRMAAAECKVADLIDVEFFIAAKPSREIKELQELGAGVIASHHDFEMTPGEDIIGMLLNKMKDSGADIVKLALMPQNKADVIRLLHQTYIFNENNPDIPLITMSMGNLGAVSRLVGEYYGSCVTFGAEGQVSAPGQFQKDELADILDKIHGNIDNKAE